MHSPALLFEDTSLTQSLEAWRLAAGLVRDRWAQFLAADRSTRPTTFAAYVAALDREAEAASELSAIAVGA